MDGFAKRRDGSCGHTPTIIFFVFDFNHSGHLIVVCGVQPRPVILQIHEVFRNGRHLPASSQLQRREHMNRKRLCGELAGCDKRPLFPNLFLRPPHLRVLRKEEPSNRRRSRGCRPQPT
ncbi:uncharacterized protein SPPG_09030 [Spizellomyces punctatus DAOM BR117]|uniref:Uncharacterized protein n=1 Tax=Spizellomyces punctatus (strain DAOM BR117) TaxID=645134 RepID=A0A0L0HLL9_SPIPD|nr:uncharacterized protein SPPG_09030 [Spizellomyces punctatus DAOM BR117]KND02012.1 hypothetical protein SPPG_09030 [Spizellomyces punctatus DAOM BR117]|eukprot:XP_016610051.1 hypothetical protein SPPG_09030 [Spizellomyces punctatus DAOM BR117]